MALESPAEGLLVLVSDGHSDEIDLEAVALQEAQGGLETQGFYIFPNSEPYRRPETGRDVVVPDPAALLDPVDVESGVEEVGMDELEDCGDFSGKARNLGPVNHLDPLQLFEEELLLARQAKRSLLYARRSHQIPPSCFKAERPAFCRGGRAELP